ncbi:MAG: CBS domain-containing protein [Candidatus Marinimicrobia bacterium]|jgi:magnesium transporter|nr:CBS domain-containing protein [Candidatus Neomarinimicrobiota bacterium]MDD4960817.1 CBS domain-containing protein [Candidatus Neomarinimicrobiota bacterium]MDD5709629.1 CBS domain-containing protein [Candidatus Neomarinimicrobiota bacterium]MDX9777376.1 CBS domain-containing protein [bacterium]
MAKKQQSMYRSVMEVASRDCAVLREASTVREALDYIRERGISEKIIYFYVLDEEKHLIGVIPTRRLLTAELERPIREVMIKKVISIPEDATILDAHELLARYKYLALPVVDKERKLIGTVDVGMFLEEKFMVPTKTRMDEVFETIGFRVSQVRGASPFRAFRFRFPWLLSTIAGGLLCAVLTSIYNVTLEQSLILAFFLTLVLGLGESVSMQSMTVTIQALRSTHPTLKWYLRSFWHEAGTALLLGAASGLLVGLVVFLWRSALNEALVIGGGILLSMTGACLFGLSIPALLHALRLDPKIAAGPLTLAVADICTIVFYFGLASLLL